jgi:MFS family permease
MKASIKCVPGLTLDQSVAVDLDAVYVKIAKRIIPFVVLLFSMAWLDRYNLSFARRQLVEDLKFSDAVFGFGSGVVYLGYALFEIPSNLFLEKIGARKTFARITILWGLTSVATMFVRTPMQFYILRFLLGSFEAGLFPGVLLYLTYWFPARRSAQMVSLFVASMPMSQILSNPVSGLIMDFMGGRAGLANWQWLFLLEGIPSIVLGILALLIMVDKPEEARWLTQGEKRLVLGDLEADRRAAWPREHGFGQALKLPMLWLLAVTRFFAASSNMTIAFWVPTIIHEQLGVKSDFTVAMLYDVAMVAAIVGLVLVGRHSDRTLERRYHSALPYLASGLGLIGIGVFADWPVLAFACLVIAVAGPIMANGPFWQIPRMLLAGPAAAGGIALINSIGSLTGWVGSSIIGGLKHATGKTTSGLYVLAGFVILGTILLLFAVPRSICAGVTAPYLAQDKPA